jgi:hypothetical protein
LPENTDDPGNDFSFFPAVVVSDVRHDQVTYKGANIAHGLKQGGDPFLRAHHNDSVVESNGLFERLFEMIIPELLIIVAANKFLAGLIVRHFCFGALEFRDIVEEVEREEDHGCDKPFQCEDQEQTKLVLILSTYSLEQTLDLVLFCP